jgi:type IV pilus assembly protein PilB
VLAVTDEIRRLMVDRGSQSQVRAVAKAQGMRTLALQAVDLALEGTTTLAEVLRTVVVA